MYNLLTILLWAFSLTFWLFSVTHNQQQNYKCFLTTASVLFIFRNSIRISIFAFSFYCTDNFSSVWWTLSKLSVSFTTLDFFAMEWISGVVFSVSSFFYVSTKVRLHGMDTFFPFLHHFILFSSAADVVLSIMLVSQQPLY